MSDGSAINEYINSLKEKSIMKTIAVEKMSKKAQKEYYAKQRNGWGGLSPVTRCPDRPNAYNRAREKRAVRAEY